MKLIITSLFILSLVTALTGCDEPKQITGQEFRDMLKQDFETMRHTEYVGVKDSKAILKVSEMSSMSEKKWTDSYYYTATTNLPSEWLTERTTAPSK